MRDIPVFSTENGVGSLILREIPYRGVAYLNLRSAAAPEAFVAECGEFCRAAGAERMVATGNPCLEKYPLYATVFKMQGSVADVGDTDGAIFPVTEQTLSRFLEIYNEKMASVPTAAYMTKAEGEKLLQAGKAYFVHRQGELLGIGIAGEESVDAIAACQRGAGREVLSALCRALSGERVTLEVEAGNLPAVRLYEKCGFVKTGEPVRWYQIF